MVSYSPSTSRAVHKLVRPEDGTVPAWAHPEVIYWYDQWQIIRDCVEGERAVKARRTAYIPKLDGMDTDEEYNAYLGRGTFYNFTGRTIMAMTGTLFRRAPVLKGIPAALEKQLETVSDEGASFRAFAQQVGMEILTLARTGVLLDLPADETTEPTPYLTAYTAENILDWTFTKNRKGRRVLSSLTLREFELLKSAKEGIQQYAARYRILSLDGGVYTSTYYTNPNGDADITATYRQPPVTPMRKGKPLDFIPFQIFGIVATSGAVEKSPTLDIANLNISHFRSYVHLEHGTFFTGLPVYQVEVSGDSRNDYKIGPSTVWETEQGCSAKIIECNGQGLKFLENSCATKEAQAASLGGRLIGVTAQSTAETDNQTKLKERNEQAILLSISMGLDAGFTQLMRWWVWWSGESSEVADGVAVEFNKDFLFDSTGAREFRAIQSMYEAGILPIEVVFDALKKAEVIPDFMQVDEFKALLESKTSFPNNPDFDARKEGYPDAQAKVTAENQSAQRDADADLLDTELADAEKARKDAAKLAAKKPAPTAAPPKRPV